MQFLLPTAYSLQPTALRKRSAFTLTEMLVVITIIAVLAALASVAVVRALDTAKQTRQKTEVDAIDAAFKAYKEKYGSYPPCDLRLDDTETNPKKPKYNAALRQHLARAFPRYNWGTALQLKNDLINAGVDVTTFRPDQAIVFWLGGFNPDVSQPLSNLKNLTKAQRTPAFYDFDTTRLVLFQTPSVSTNSIPSYFPQGIKMDGTQGPYVYFDNHSTFDPSGTACTFYGMPPKPIGSGGSAVPNVFNAASTPNIAPCDIPGQAFFTEAGPAIPYWNDVNGNGKSVAAGALEPGEDWANPDSFQIIGPGLDGKYGSEPSGFYGVRLYPTGVTGASTPLGAVTNSQDDDNVTNFCPRARLGDAKP